MGESDLEAWSVNMEDFNGESVLERKSLAKDWW
jgi:hypothetical protein